MAESGPEVGGGSEPVTGPEIPSEVTGTPSGPGEGVGGPEDGERGHAIETEELIADHRFSRPESRPVPRRAGDRRKRI